MTIAVVSGSFDPITKGHLYVIEQARKMADKVIVLIANNPDKKYYFTKKERSIILVHALAQEFGEDVIWKDKIILEDLPNDRFTANIAKEFGASMIVRGLRNVVDFEYEHSQQLINSVIEPSVTTIFVMPPTDLIAVSSSAIKSLVGIEGWETVAAKYIPPVVLNALKGIMPS